MMAAVTFHRPTARNASRTSTARVRVVVADDHLLFRDGIERAVRARPDLELVGSASDGRVALRLVNELQPDVAVLDVRLPGLDGLQILTAVTRDGLATRVLILSVSTDPELVYRAVQGGAAGYFRKETDRSTILDAIAAAARGGTVVDPALQAGVFEQVRLRRDDRERPILTAREHQLAYPGRGTTVRATLPPAS